MADVVASIVEKVLMNIGLGAYARVRDALHANNIAFLDCYQNPLVLKSALEQVFNHDYVPVVERIKNEFGSLADDDHNLANFIQKLNG